jgi:hypothetical protein
MTDKTGGPAFPIVGQWGVSEQGITTRDYFAAKALQTGYKVVKDYYVIDKDELAKWCFEMADAMLKAREQ